MDKKNPVTACHITILISCIVTKNDVCSLRHTPNMQWLEYSRNMLKRGCGVYRFTKLIDCCLASSISGIFWTRTRSTLNIYINCIEMREIHWINGIYNVYMTFCHLTGHILTRAATFLLFHASRVWFIS